VVAKQVSSLPGIDNDLFSKLPRRIGDKQGNPGDMVNFLSWFRRGHAACLYLRRLVKVDANVEATVLHGLIESLSKEST